MGIGVYEVNDLAKSAVAWVSLDLSILLSDIHRFLHFKSLPLITCRKLQFHLNSHFHMPSNHLGYQCLDRNTIHSVLNCKCHLFDIHCICKHQYKILKYY